ncbi:MAG: hypothetical protein ABI224_05265 [Acetobacteraceae bacterium]
MTPRASGMMDRLDHKQAIAPKYRGGIAFTVPELLMLTAWAEFHALRLVIELDHCIDGAEYEEVAALYPADSPLRQWTLWRAADGVVAEPMAGACFREACISDVLQRVIPAC